VDYFGTSPIATSTTLSTVLSAALPLDQLPAFPVYKLTLTLTLTLTLALTLNPSPAVFTSGLLWHFSHCYQHNTAYRTPRRATSGPAAHLPAQLRAPRGRDVDSTTAAALLTPINPLVFTIKSLPCLQVRVRVRVRALDYSYHHLLNVGGLFRHVSHRHQHYA